MRRRLWPLIVAILVIIALLMYPSNECRVTQADLAISPPKAFIIDIEEGYAVGFSFNVTNRAKCDINAQNIRVILHNVAYSNGTQVTPNSDETGPVTGTLKPGDFRTFSYSFNSYFTYRPTKLTLTIKMTFAETGSVLVFDGELPVPPS
jgi:hypothetical protein